MFIKFNRATGSSLTAPDSAAFTFPNGDWALGFFLQLDGDQTNTNAEYIVSNAPFSASGSVQVAYRTAASSANAGRVVLYYGTTATVRIQSPAVVTSGTHLFVVQRSGGNLSIKQCPVLATAPTDGSAVLTQSIGTPTTAFDGTGMAIGNRQDLPSDRLCDQSIGRVFKLDSALTDLEIARLAYGEEITALGKTPAWYLRMNDVNDIADLGPSAITFTKNGAPTTSTTQPGFGYAPPGVAPALTGSPVITGSVQVGSTSGYTPAYVTGTPSPTRSQEWRLAGTLVSTASTYTWQAADVGKSATVTQIESNGVGSPASATSAPVTVAAAPVNNIDGNELIAERICQRANGVFPVALSGTYTGSAPTTIEYQLYASDGTTILQPWTVITGATIGSGTWSGTVNMPQGGKYRIAYRGNNGSVSQVKTNRFGVGALGVFFGSSSAERPFNSQSGTGFNPADNVSKLDGTTWSTFGTDGAAILFANSMAAQAGVPVGLLDCGDGGTLLSDWLNTNGAQWTALKNTITAAGGKLEFAYIAIGSNDAATSTVTSRASHLNNLKQLVMNLRTYTGQPNLPVIVSGMNRRTAYTVPLATYTQQANYVRMAEVDIGDDPDFNVYYVPTHDLLMRTDDGTHLATSSGGFPASLTRAAYIGGGAIYGGVYRRGAKIANPNYNGADVIFTVTHRNGTDFSLPSALAAITATDDNGTPTLSSVTKLSANSFKATFDRSLVNPKIAYMSGGAPAVNTQFLDNGSSPLPFAVNTDMTATQVADTANPALSGNVTVTNISSTSATLTSPEAVDDVAVIGYEYRMNPTGSYTEIPGGARTVNITTLTPSTQYQPQMQAFDAAGKRSMPISAAAPFTTLAAPDTTKPVLPGPLTITPAIGGGTVAWQAATDNVGIAGYERQIDGGAWVSTQLNRTVTFTGLSAGSHPVGVRAVDTSGNYSDPLTGTLVAQADNSGGAPNYTPSKVRTIKAKAGGGFTLESSFWATGPDGVPTGVIDPDSEVDITMDWSEVLSDISDTIAQGDIDVDGATAINGYTYASSSTVFVDDPQSSGVTIRFRMESASVPPRVEDRTVKLTVAEQ